MTDVRTGPTEAYLALSDEDQVEALRPAALEAAAGFGLAVASAEVVAHAYNTTFSVTTTDGARWALRVGTSSQSTPAHAVAQQEWLRAIATETDVHVPEPLATPDGAWFVHVGSQAYDRPLLVTAASWLEGPDVGRCDEEVAHALGRAMAVLHTQSAGWAIPDGGSLPTFDRRMFGDEDRLDEVASLTDDDREVLARTRERTAEGYRRVYEGAAVQVLHADLHGGNLKWHDGRLAVFDLDDCGLGVPALDLAISTFYLRDGDPGPERGLLAGYAEVAPLPDADPADVEALMADRQMLLANTILTSSAADLRSEAETYLPVAVRRLRRWLDTGVLTRAPFDD